ncbi:MAG: baculoviral IAP repeat-containing protein [Roseburia sp.]|nr:baculoviral IAP repeat-containing protein [Roseburia sp.]
MYCYNCGKQIDDKAVICVNCGVAVGEQSETDRAADEHACVSPECGNTVALVGFILSLVGALFCVIMFISTGIFLVLALLFGVASIVCSAVGMNRAKHKSARYQSLAIAGLTVGIVTVAITLLVIIIAVAVASSLLF